MSADYCTGAPGCPVHPGVLGYHEPWGLADPGELAQEHNMINAALERAIGDPWDGDDGWPDIARRWIEHMATTHGADCPGPHCGASSFAPSAAEAAIREHLRDVSRVPYELQQFRPPGYYEGYSAALRDLMTHLNLTEESPHG